MSVFNSFRAFVSEMLELGFGYFIGTIFSRWTPTSMHDSLNFYVCARNHWCLSVIAKYWNGTFHFIIYYYKNIFFQLHLASLQIVKIIKGVACVQRGPGRLSFETRSNCFLSDFLKLFSNFFKISNCFLNLYWLGLEKGLEGFNYDRIEGATPYLGASTR